MAEIRSKYYRLSVKALILNETRDKFLVTKKSNGVWDLPGGGLEWGESPHDGLCREIEEEMKLPVASIAARPSYFLGGYPMTPQQEVWMAIVVYETVLGHLNFTPSDECEEIRFISTKDVETLNSVPPTVRDLLQQFQPDHHR